MIGLVESIRSGKVRRNSGMFPRSMDKDELIAFLEDNGFENMTGSVDLASTLHTYVSDQMRDLVRNSGKKIYVLGDYHPRIKETHWIRFCDDKSGVYFVRTSDSGISGFFVDYQTGRNPDHKTLDAKSFFDEIEKQFGWK